MELMKELSENKFLMVLLTEKQYERKLAEIVKNVEKSHTMVCYVCLSKPYADVTVYLERLGVDIKKFFFIDVLSSHYQKPKAASNCTFIDEPAKLVTLQVAISKVIGEKKCNVVVFDTISSLLMYEQTFDILRFTHQLTIEKRNESVNKVFIILKGNGITQEYNNSFINDISMFADKTIELK